MPICVEEHIVSVFKDVVISPPFNRGPMENDVRVGDLFFTDQGLYFIGYEPPPWGMSLMNAFMGVWGAVQDSGMAKRLRESARREDRRLTAGERFSKHRGISVYVPKTAIVSLSLHKRVIKCDSDYRSLSFKLRWTDLMPAEKLRNIISNYVPMPPEKCQAPSTPGRVDSGWERVGGGYDAAKSKASPGSSFVDSNTGAAVVYPPVEPWAYGVELFLSRPTRTSLRYLLVAELLVRKGVVGVGILNAGGNDFLFRKSLAANSAPQSVEIPISNFSQIGRFVIQNWDSHGESNVELLAISNYVPTPPEGCQAPITPGREGGRWERVGGGYDAVKSKVSPGSRFVDPNTGTTVVDSPVEPWAYGAELFLNRPTRTSPQYLLTAELLVRKGVVGVGILNIRETDFLFRKSLAANSAPQSVEIPISNFSQIGRFVIQNWDSHGESNVELLALRLFAEAA